MTKLIIAALAAVSLTACEDDLNKLKGINDPNVVVSPTPAPSLSPVPIVATPTPDAPEEEDLGKLPVTVPSKR